MLALAVAYSQNRVIGHNGVIPWKIKGEQKRFRELTTGKIVVMGRKTFEEIGKPLPDRTTYLISRNTSFCHPQIHVATSLQEVLDLERGKDIFISGGARLYEEALPMVDKMYITVVEREYEGDTFFPEFNPEEFMKIAEEHHQGEIPYTYLTYERKER